MHSLRTRCISALLGGFAMVYLFPAFLTHAQNNDVIFSVTGNADSPLWGRTSNTTAWGLGQGYLAASNTFVCGVRHKVAKNGTPTDGVVFTLYAGGSNPENGTILVSSTVAAAALPTNTATETDFKFGACYYLTAGQTYYFTLRRTGALNDSNNYFSRIQTPSGGWAYIGVSGGWVASNALAVTAYGISNTSFFTPPTSTTSSANWTLTCDNQSGAFASSLCYIGGYLFVPNEDIFNNFGDIYNQIKNKPPIGYFYAITDAFNGLGTSTAPYSLASVSAFSGFFSPIRTALAWILWLIFGFWVLNRLRHITL